MSRSRLFFPARVRKGGSGSHRRKEVHAHQNFKEAEQIINHINMTSLNNQKIAGWHEADDQPEAVHRLEADDQLQ